MSFQSKDIFSAVGRLTLAWTHLENKLFYLFLVLTELNQARAEAIFYTLRSNPPRLEMIEALLEAQIKDNNLRKRFVDLRKRFTTLSKKRNNFAHKISQISANSDDRALLIDPRRETGGPSEPITANEVDQITREILALYADYDGAISDLSQILPHIASPQKSPAPENPRNK